MSLHAGHRTDRQQDECGSICRNRAPKVSVLGNREFGHVRAVRNEYLFTKMMQLAEFDIPIRFGMVNDCVHTLKDCRKFFKIRLVGGLEQIRISTWNQYLACTYERHDRPCGIEGPLLRGVKHHDVELAFAQKIPITIDFTPQAADIIAPYGKLNQSYTVMA